MSYYRCCFHRVIPGLILLVILLAACTTALPTGTSTPTTAAVTSDEKLFQIHTYGPLKGSAPSGWVAISANEVMRGLPHEDPTSISVLSIPGMTIQAALPEIEAALGVDDIPEPFECLYNGVFDWQCYEFESDQLSIHAYAPRTFGPLTVHFSLADSYRGLVAVILTCRPEEKEQLYRAVLKPVLQSLAWDVPSPEAAAGIRLVEPPERNDWPTAGWPRADPEQHGLDSQKLAEMADYIRKYYIRIGSITIIRHGYLVYDEQFPSFVTRHNNYSVTKSVTSALVGIAIDQGYLSGVDAPVLDFFPDREIKNLDARKKALTVHDLLSMTAGMDWPEGPFEGLVSPDYTTIQMAQKADYVQFVLDRPMAADPGTTFVYNSGASHLLSAIIQETTGQSAYGFAEKNLFRSLGIDLDPAMWAEDPQGYTIGYSQLRLEPQDLAKIGYLYLNQGRWDDEQVISREWIQASTRNHSPPGGPAYGYQWWLEPDINAFSARGLHGQAIVILPDIDMVVVFTSSLVPGIQESNPGLMLRLFILPAVLEAPGE